MGRCHNQFAELGYICVRMWTAFNWHGILSRLLLGGGKESLFFVIDKEFTGKLV